MINRTPADVIKMAKEHSIESVDLKFCDIHGRWQHFSIPVKELNDDLFENGHGFDGSSIRGWKGIEASDMLVLPDPNTAFVDPFIARPTISLICDVEDPLTREYYSRDPRGIAKKAEAHLKSTGIGDTSWFGPEAEFFIFDTVRYESGPNVMFHQVDGIEAPWRSADEVESAGQPNRGYKIAHKEGYLPVPPQDKLQDIRDEMVAEMERAGIDIETHHHEVATAGQAEIDMRFDTLLRMADKLCLYKYIVKNVAYRNGKTATFMPKPLFGDNGSGMHCHSSIWKGGQPTFHGNGYAGLSDSALYYIGGLLKHAPAICAITNPTNNSYKRLVPGYEAPVNLAYSARNRSAICRIPTYSPSPKAKRVEFRCPDPSANPYLSFAAILLAGLDGVKNKIHPGDPMDKNLYDLPPEEAAKIKTVPESLKGALEALEADHEFLLAGDVFTQDFIDNFIELKKVEYDAIRLRPHPQEYVLYYDV